MNMRTPIVYAPGSLVWVEGHTATVQCYYPIDKQYMLIHRQHDGIATCEIHPASKVTPYEKEQQIL